MGVPRQLPFPPPGDLPDPGIKPAFYASPALAGRFLTTVPPGKPLWCPYVLINFSAWISHKWSHPKLLKCHLKCCPPQFSQLLILNWILIKYEFKVIRAYSNPFLFSWSTLLFISSHNLPAQKLALNLEQVGQSAALKSKLFFILSYLAWTEYICSPSLSASQSAPALEKKEEKSQFLIPTLVSQINFLISL